MELRDPEAARDWLAAGLSLIRVGRPGSETLRRVTPWLRAGGAELAHLPPPGLIGDVGQLLSQASARIVPGYSGPIQKTLRSYEDQVVGRIAIDPLREAAADAIHALPAHLQPIAIALFVERILERVGFEQSVAIDPGALRDLDAKTSEEWLVRGSAALHGPAAELLESQYAELIACFQRVGRPIEASDVAVLEQLEVLQLRSERLALAQVIDAAMGLSMGLPRRMKASRRRAGHVSTKLEDDSAYPVGGFSSISNRGSMENLVTSELALMEDDPDLDLFDVRYAEGELLYYTRDETAFVRDRRRITLVLDADLDEARYRDEGLPWQRLVIALGLVRCLVETLSNWLNRQDLHIRIAVPPQALREEARILSLALAEWIEAGLASIEPLERPALIELLEADTKSAPTDAIWLAAGKVQLPDIENAWVAAVRCAANPEATGPFGAIHGAEGPPWAAWQQVTARLLADLM